MKKATKIWLVIAAALVLLGCILFFGVMTNLRWDFTRLSTVAYEINTYEIQETFDSISVYTDTADIVFTLSNDGKCKVECHEEENAKHSVTVEDGTLTVAWVDERSVSDYIQHIGFNIGSPKVTVYLPKTEYTALFIRGETCDVEIPHGFRFKNAELSTNTGDVTFDASASGRITIKTNTGDIHVENTSAGVLDLSVSTGMVTASGVTCRGDVTVGVSTGKTYLIDILCKNVISRGDTGDISLQNVIAAETFSIERSTGNVIFDGCDAAEIWVETDTGDVAGTFLSEKCFLAKTDAGTVAVPQSTAGGKCEVTTDTGDIKLNVP